jgi:hypothetical protein
MYFVDQKGLGPLGFDMGRYTNAMPVHRKQKLGLCTAEPPRSQRSSDEGFCLAQALCELGASVVNIPSQ